MQNIWSKHISYKADYIKKANPIPGLVKNLCVQLPTKLSIKHYYHDLMIILTELYNNSLDHGLLGISSEIKNKNKKNNLSEYYNIRKQKLEELSFGFINFSFLYFKSKDLLIIEITDSGKGFDYKNYLNNNLVKNSPMMLHKLSGRGLYIINKIVDHLRFKNNGSTIRALYKLHSKAYNIYQDKENNIQKQLHSK